MQTRRFIYATIDCASGAPPVADYAVLGIGAEPLELVRCRDLAAVVSSIDLEQLALESPATAATAQQAEARRAALLAYQQVNLFILAHSGAAGMVPLRFGFTAGDDDEVRGVLENAYVQLRTYLDRLRGTVELVLQASWDLPAVLRGIARDNPECARAAPAQAGRLLFEAAAKRKKSLVAAIHAALSPLSRDHADAPLTTEAMILNRSYLVAKDQESPFDDALNSVATEFEDALTFRYLGPLPVYSFVDIELRQGNFAVVDAARRALGLPETALWQVIKAAYRELVQAHHPDRHSDDVQGAAARTQDVVTAYEVVRAYCRSLDARRAPGEPQLISFAREAVERAFVVDDRGAALGRAGSIARPS